MPPPPDPQLPTPNPDVVRTADGALTFEVTSRDAGSNARTGRVHTPHGSFDTPAFMPVGTQATIKGLLPRDVAGTGAQTILANTYHLMLRPGSELVERMGGLHGWMGWGRADPDRLGRLPGLQSGRHQPDRRRRGEF